MQTGMRARSCGLLMLITLFIGAPERASGKDKACRWEFDLYGGATFGNQSVRKTLEYGRIGMASYGGGGVNGIGGLRLGFTLYRIVGLEADFGWSSIQHKAELQSDAYEPGEIVDTQSSDSLGHFHLNLLLELPLGPVSIFGTGGVGWTLFVNSEDLTYNFGGGLKVFLGRHVMLRVDARYYICPLTLKLLEYQGMSDDGKFLFYPFHMKEDVHYLEVTGTIGFIF